MATMSITCGNCGQGVAADVVREGGGGNPSRVAAPVAGGFVLWLQCPACRDGSVMTASGAVYPVAPTGSPVKNLPPDTAQAWREARTSHAVAAYTASEMMCRKILMHIAVEEAKSKPGDTFAHYIDALEKAGYFPPGLKDAVDKVRQRGNTANHDLPASTEGDSISTLKITEHLLRGIYEIPSL